MENKEWLDKKVIHFKRRRKKRERKKKKRSTSWLKY